MATEVRQGLVGRRWVVHLETVALSWVGALFALDASTGALYFIDN